MPQEVFVFRIASADPARVWSGNGDLEIGPDAVEPVAVKYRGGGELLNLPTVQQLINGTAERVQFSVSAVTAEILGLALEERDGVYDAEVRIGSVPLDDDLQPAGPVLWEWKGVADVIEISTDPIQDGGRERKLMLSVGSADTSRSRSTLQFYTDADQRRISSDDAVFSHVAGISQGTTRRFGPKGL